MASKTFFCVDAHTCGNPVRVVAGGGPNLEGKNMSEKRQHFLKKYDIKESFKIMISQKK